MTTTADAAGRLRTAGLGFLLDEAASLMARSGHATADLISDPSLLRGVLRLSLNATAADALAGFLGFRQVERNRRGSQINVSLRTLDQQMMKTLGVGLVALLHNTELLATRADLRTMRHSRLASAISQLTARAPAPLRSWVQNLASDSQSGRWFRRRFHQQPNAAETTVLVVASALSLLPVTGAELLTVFAERVTGNPHAFDQNRPDGTLLQAALVDRRGAPAADKELPQAVQRAVILGMAGLQVDEISSTVAVAQFSASGHAVIDAMATHGGAWPLPLGEVRILAPEPVNGRIAYAVENPSLFQVLVNETAKWPQTSRPFLLCTAGFPSAAAYILLEKLDLVGYQIFYAGDFDRNGIAITNSLLSRLPSLTLWHMTPEAYQQAVHPHTTTRFSDDDCNYLRRLSGPLAATAAAMANRQLPAYQEALGPLLLADLQQIRQC